MVELLSRNLTPDEEEAVAAFMRRAAIVPEADRAQRPEGTARPPLEQRAQSAGAA